MTRYETKKKKKEEVTVSFMQKEGILVIYHCASQQIYILSMFSHAYNYNCDAMQSSKLSLNWNKMTINGSRWVQDQPERQQCACRNVHSEYNTWISHKNLYSLNHNLVCDFNVCLIFRAIFCGKKHGHNWTFSSSNIAILVLLKTLKYKGNWTLALS